LHRQNVPWHNHMASHTQVERDHHSMACLSRGLCHHAQQQQLVIQKKRPNSQVLLSKSHAKGTQCQLLKLAAGEPNLNHSQNILKILQIPPH
jgi:hypothetical protein